MATLKKKTVKKSTPAKPVAKKAAKKVAKKGVKKAAAKVVKKAVAKTVKPVAKKVAIKAVAKPVAKAPAKKAAVKKTLVKKAIVKKAAVKAVVKPVKKVVAKAPVKKAVAPKAAPKAAPQATRPPVSKAPTLPADPARDLAIDLARLASDLHCTDVRVQNVTGHSPLTRFMVLATGISNRQLKAVAQSMEALGGERDHPLYRMDADTNTTWVVLDLVDIMIHLFEPESRSHYDLETQFPDAKSVKWER